MKIFTINGVTTNSLVEVEEGSIDLISYSSKLGCYVAEIEIGDVTLIERGATPGEALDKLITSIKLNELKEELK